MQLETDRVELDTYGGIFCDSLEILARLRALGLPPQVPVLTRSPVVVQNGDGLIVDLENRLNVKNRKEFQETASTALIEFVERVRPMRDYADSWIAFAQQFNTWQIQLLNFAMLDESDLSERRLVTVPSTEIPDVDVRLRPAWIELFEYSGNADILSVPVHPPSERAANGEGRAGLIGRLRLVGLRSIFWRIMLYAGAKLKRTKLATIGLIGSNELLRETAIAFAQKGWLLRELDLGAGAVTPQSDDVSQASQLVETVYRVVDQTLASLPSESVRRHAKSLLVRRMAETAAQIRTAAAQTEVNSKTFDGLSAVFTGHLSGVKAVTVRDICSRLNIPVVAFQHGVTREIESRRATRAILYENTFADRFMVFNKSTIEATQAFGFGRPECQIDAVGWPLEYGRLPKWGPVTDAGPILYASPMLLAGHRANGIVLCPDKEAIVRETRLIGEVFATLPHRVDFKPYPAYRFADPDLVLEKVRETQNTSLVGTHVDLRFIAKRYRVLVTGRATSTFSWCLASGLPCVFIDSADHARLNPDVRASMEDAFFVFDEDDAEYLDALREFLSQPLEAIQSAWDTKASAREQVTKDYFAIQRSAAGSTAYDLLNPLV